MNVEARTTLNEIEQGMCDVASIQLGFPRDEVRPNSRLIEDLHCDSLDVVELFLALEDRFQVSLPLDPENPVGKSVFTRRPFRLCDLAEIIYLQPGSDRTDRRSARHIRHQEGADADVLFTQLSGRWTADSRKSADLLFESLESANHRPRFRRRSDGMQCVLLPSAEIQIGCSDFRVCRDEGPVHVVQLSSFLMDLEPVSTTAFCRFLNSVQASNECLRDWILLDATDDRIRQMQIVREASEWRPVAGTETMPMVLVSWYGASAYSLWANNSDWSRYGTSTEFLPSEAQWEFAAQGAFSDTASSAPNHPPFICGRHEHGNSYEADTMPMAPVHHPAGVSTFGLHHMAGNVWEWCRDWYDEDFYNRAEASGLNPVNTAKSGLRSERGGSWVGAAELCRTTYRRGRAPEARGRCLGFRCVSSVESLPAEV